MRCDRPASSIEKRSFECCWRLPKAGFGCLGRVKLRGRGRVAEVAGWSNPSLGCGINGLSLCREFKFPVRVFFGEAENCDFPRRAVSGFGLVETAIFAGGHFCWRPCLLGGLALGQVSRCFL
jgi:hypothetical protein